MAKRVPVKTALVGLLVAPTAMAQQDPAQTPAPAPATPSTENQPAAPAAAPATMQTVTVTGSRPSEDFQVTRGSINRLGAANLMDVPQSVVVINRALMQSQGVTRLEDAVRNAPGVTIGSAEGGAIGTNININGFSARTDIYLDGMRDRGQYYRDVFALEQVEVLMGPSSMLFGRGSTGGVINQVAKKPSLKQATELSAQATTNGLVRTTADVNTPVSGDQCGPRIGDVPGRQGLDRRPDQHARLRPGADGETRHRHTDGGHAGRLPDAPQGSGELRRAQPQRLSAQCATQYRLGFQ
jgi:catecholate siderophore receptor